MEGAIDVSLTPERGGDATGPRIERTAVELFFGHGYPKTSIREITMAIGLTPGAFYNHYASKEELLHAIVSKTHIASERVFYTALERAGDDPARQLWEVARSMTLFHGTNRMEAIIARNEWRRLPDAQAADVLASERRIRRAVEHILARGVAAGAFTLRRPDGRPADLPVTAKAILDLIIHVGLWFQPDGRVSPADIADQYGILVLQLVGADTNPSSTKHRRTKPR